MSDLRKTFELAFKIGGALSPSFKAAHSEAAAQIAKLSGKSQEAMKFNKLQKEFDKSFQDFTDKANEMGAAWKGVVDSIVGPIKEIAVIGTVAGAAIYGLAAKTAQMGDTAVKNALKMGVTTEEYSKMAFAANQSGISTEHFAGNMKSMNRIMSEAIKKGTSEVYVNNKRLMSIRDENKQLKSRRQLLLDASEAYKKLTNENEKFTFATIMFGKSGSDMIPMLEQGSAGIQKLMDDAQRLGIVFDDVSGARAGAFIDSMGELKAAAQGLAISVGAQLHEPLTKVNNAIVEWITANRELIGQKVGEFVQDIVTWVKENKEGIIDLKKSVVEFIHQIGVWIEKNGGLLEVLKKVGKAFVLFKAAGVGFSLLSAAAATLSFGVAILTLITQTKLLLATFGGFKVVAGLIAGAAAPVAIWIGIIAGIGFILYKVIKNGKDLIYFFTNMAQTVPILINDLVEDIKGAFGKLPGWLQNILAPIKNIILSPLQAVQDLLAGNIKGFFINMGKFIIGKILFIPSIIATTGNEIIKALFGIDIIGAVKEWISPAINVISEIWNTGIGAIKNFVIGEFNDIKDAFGGGFFNGVFEIINKIPTLFIRMGNDVIKAITGIDIISTVSEWLSPVIDTVNEVIDNIKATFFGAVDFVKGFFLNDLMNIKAAFSDGFLNGIDNIIKQLITLIPRLLNETVKAITGIDLIDTGKKWFQKFIDGILSVIKNAGSIVKDAVVKLIPESVINFAGGAAKAVSGTVKAVGGAAKSVSQAMPKFSDGGIATEPSLAAEDGKPEMIIPLTKPRRALELVKTIMPVLPKPELQAIKAAAPERSNLPKQKTNQPMTSPLDDLRGAMTSNNTTKINSGSFTFSPTINITGVGGDSVAITAAVEDAFAKVRSDLERLISQREYNNKRVAMA